MTALTAIVLVLPYVAALLFAIAELRGRLPARAPRTPAFAPWVWIVALIFTYAVQLAAIRYAATHLTDSVAWRLTMPFPVADVDMLHPDAVAAVYVACAVLQSYALLALYRGRPSKRAVVAGSALLAAMSLTVPALASFDAYGYVHNAILGLQSYAPPARPFQGEYHVIDLWFGKPTATLYGPLWLAIDRIVTVAAPTLLTKIAALRVFNALLYAALIAILRGIGLPRRIVAAVALNPGMMFQFITNVHNDIIAIDLLLGAAALARTRAAAASGLFAAAGLVKLPYLALGLPVFSAARPMSQRLIAIASGIGAAAAVSWFAGGGAYLAALTHHASPAYVALAWRLIPAGVALAALVAALLGARRYIAALWFIPSIGAFELPWVTGSGQTFAMPWILPWYFAWGLPYALNRHRILGFLAVAFPLLAAVVAPEVLRLRVLLVLEFAALVVCASRWFLRPAMESSAS
jgi:hypothetical protein